MTDFEKFFAGEFQQRLAAANVPDMTDASWDRRAAWLLYVAENRHVFKTPAAPPATKPELKGGLFD